MTVIRSTSTRSAIRSTIAWTTRVGSSDAESSLVASLVRRSRSTRCWVDSLASSPSTMMLTSSREPVHDGPLGITEAPAFGTPETDHAHTDASVGERHARRHRHQPPDANLCAEDLGRRALPRGVFGLHGEPMKHCAAVQHSLVQGPLRADQAFRPRAGRGDDLEYVLPRSRNNRDDTFSVRDHASALDCHGVEQIPQRHRLARVGRNIVEEPRDQSTERFVDARCLLGDRHVRVG